MSENIHQEGDCDGEFRPLPPDPRHPRRDYEFLVTQLPVLCAARLEPSELGKRAARLPDRGCGAAISAAP